MDEVASHTTTDGRATKNGKKRAKEMEPKEEKKRKRRKVEGPSDKPDKISVKVPKRKAQKGRAQLNGSEDNSTSTAFLQPKWKVFQTKTPRAAQKQPSLSELKPRIWTSSREELAVLLPELAGPKCLNGVSWLMYETPMVLLDESNTCFDILLQEDTVTLDLLTTRGFTCSWPPRSEKVSVPPESSSVDDVLDGNCSNWSTTVTSSSKDLPTTKSSPTATTVSAGGPTDLAHTPPEDAALIGVSFPLSTHTPLEPAIKDHKATWSEGFAPAVPIYSQDKQSVSESSTEVPGGAFSDVFMRRGRRTEAAGRKEAPEGSSIDFSTSSVPSYVLEPVRFSVPLENAQFNFNKGIGNTATMHRPPEASSSLIPPYVPTTKIGDRTYSTSPLMTPPYETKYTVSTDISFTNSDDMDSFLSKAFSTLSLHQSSDHLPSANIALNAGPASWIEPDLNKPYPSDPTKPKIELQATETVESTEHASDKAEVKQIQDAALRDTFIPSTVPEEIQAIIDSYLSGRPLLLVISNKRFFDYWSLRLPKEFGFIMLGYFRILGVQESRVHPNDPAPPLNDGPELITGRVKWCFRLRWSPGGEEWILPNHDKDLLERPWWKSPSPQSILPLEEIPSLDAQSIDNLIFNPTAPGISQEISACTPPLVASTFESQVTGGNDITTPFEPESTFDTTPRYRVARLSNVNYDFRHAHFRELYHSLVPLQLLAPYGRTVLDSSFPRGWLCKACGKMNFQAALRHRVCSSSFCKGLKPETAPYAIELMFMRNPQDNLPMVLPYNEPLLINLVDTWEDGTRMLPYYIHGDKNIFIKHIFTCNLPLLQLEASRLLHFIQLEVELLRPIGGNSPYFQYSAYAPKDDLSPTTSEWPNVPPSINHARDWTQHQAMWFGELQEGQLSINHLCLLAWVTSGIKRGPATVRAKEKCVVFHAFGCNITVIVTPLSSKTTPVKVDGVDIDSLSLIPMDNLPSDEPDVNPGWIAGLNEEDEDEDEDEAIEDPSHEDRERLPATNSKKASPFLFTLVHGDVLVFYGDDFEYSLKRAGTSFLLITSHLNDP